MEKKQLISVFKDSKYKIVQDIPDNELQEILDMPIDEDVMSVIYEFYSYPDVTSKNIEQYETNSCLDKAQLDVLAFWVDKNCLFADNLKYAYYNLLIHIRYSPEIIIYDLNYRVLTRKDEHLCSVSEFKWIEKDC